MSLLEMHLASLHAAPVPDPRRLLLAGAPPRRAWVLDEGACSSIWVFACALLLVLVCFRVPVSWSLTRQPAGCRGCWHAGIRDIGLQNGGQWAMADLDCRSGYIVTTLRDGAQSRIRRESALSFRRPSCQSSVIDESAIPLLLAVK